MNGKDRMDDWGGGGSPFFYAKDRGEYERKSDMELHISLWHHNVFQDRSATCSDEGDIMPRPRRKKAWSFRFERNKRL